MKSHVGETKEHVTLVEQVFETFDKKTVAAKCGAIVGLIEEIIENCETGSMCDAGIISAQKVEHYEIAFYGKLRHFAGTLGLTEAITLLDATLICLCISHF
ncbi:ferritin-like domain-containing protein [Emticicia sp.]|uniref:YciE/YciF ferroxidase family protein n=1 Tax=Emticicia sp. TaxID=1930953 RepID=UPI003753956A